MNIKTPEKSEMKLIPMLATISIILVMLLSYVIVIFAQPVPPPLAASNIGDDSMSTIISKKTIPPPDLGLNFTNRINYFQESNITQITSQQNSTEGIGADSFSIISRQEPNNNQNTTNSLASREQSQ